MARGRPSKFKPEFVEQARKLCEFGATDDEMADFFGVDRATFYRWRATHDELRDALKAGKSAADERVERRLYERALGYSHPAVKIMQYEGSVIREEYTEHYPPDPTSMIFWLKNRRPQDWRDVHKIEHSGSLKTEREMSEDELLRIAAAGSHGNPETQSGPEEPAAVH